MCYAPRELLDLQAYWKSKGGVSLGIVGDTSHQRRGGSYHLGKDHLTSTAYSNKTSRDKAGLTNAASAFDMGKLNGSLHQLRQFSRWFAGECKAKKPGYRDVREVIFWSETRERVIGWSALAPDVWINDYGDLSHKTHTHISFFRDSEKRDKTAMFKPYWPAAPAPVEDDMPALSAYLPGHVCIVKKTSNVRTAPAINASVIRNLTAPESWQIAGRVKGGVDPEGGSDQWFTRWNAGRWEYTAFSNVTSTVPPAGAAELAAVQAQLVAVKTDLGACNAKVANAKAALG